MIRIKRFSTSVASKPVQIQRFYKNVNLKETSEGISVLLDQRELKTPNGAVIRVPKDRKMLAIMTALEWERQTTALKQYALPLVLRFN